MKAQRRDSESRHPVGASVKRAMDVAVASVALIIVSPIMACVAIAIYATMGQPVLFRQLRAGLGGRPFYMLKFRSMRRSSSSAWDPSTDSDRITAVGRILRRWSLDELPQLWNVLRGDMALVGPRPLPVEYLPRYSADQARRHLKPPGITGWAQINGRNDVTWERRFEDDIWYVEHWSILLDLKILLRTVSRVAGGGGVSGAGQATMIEFRGSATTRVP